MAIVNTLSNTVNEGLDLIKPCTAVRISHIQHSKDLEKKDLEETLSGRRGNRLCRQCSSNLSDWLVARVEYDCDKPLISCLVQRWWRASSQHKHLLSQPGTPTPKKSEKQSSEV